MLLCILKTNDMLQKFKSLIQDIVLITAISVIVNIIMRPKKVEQTFFDDVDYNHRLEVLETRMEFNRDLAEKQKLTIDSIANSIKTNQTKITYVKSNKNSLDKYISTLTTNELVSKLSERYKDSIN